jgi:hypothetical protein
MTETKEKKQRAPKALTPDAIVIQLEKQPLETQMSIWSLLKKMIDDPRGKLQQDLELINANMK